MAIEPLEVGVCSWSLQVTSVPQLEGFMKQLGVGVCQIAFGDPTHATWDEGDDFAKAAKAADFRISGGMLGFPGEDYASPQAIKATGGFGDPERREERLERVQWACEKSVEMGLDMLSLHAGFIPEESGPERSAILDCLNKTAEMAAAKDLTVSLETGQETAEELKKLLGELAQPNIKVNFDPANVILYDMGDPIAAVDTLAEHIVHVHCKDANYPKTQGQWGEEVVLGTGQVNIPRFVEKLKEIGYAGPLVIEREFGTQPERLRDVARGVEVLRECGGK